MSLNRICSLIKEFTPPEKRYAHVMAKRLLSIEEPKIIGLLNAIQRHTEKPEKELTAALNKQFDSKSLPSDLKYLYRFLLKALRAYHEESSVDTQIRTWLTNSQLLLDKRLYELSFKELERAKKMAIRHEHYSDLIRIYQLEASIVIEHKPKELLEELDKIVAEAHKALEALNTTSKVYFNERQTFALVRSSYQLRGEDRTNLLDKIAEDQNLEQLPSAKFRTARLYYLKMQASISICRGDFTTSSNIYDEMIEIWESDNVRLKEDILEYKKLLSNKLAALHASNEFEKMPALLRKIKSIPCTSSEEEAEQFQNIYFMELLFRMNTDLFEGFDAFVRQIDDGIKKYRTKVNQARLQLFYYNISVCYFSLHEWKKSLEWLMKIIDQPKNDHRKDIQHFARLFRLILFYELGKHDLLEYELINTERYLRQNKAWFTFESAIVKFLKKFLAADENDRSLYFKKFREQIREISGGQSSAVLPGITELQLWSTYRINNIPIRQLINDKNMQ